MQAVAMIPSIVLGALLILVEPLALQIAIPLQPAEKGADLGLLLQPPVACIACRIRASSMTMFVRMTPTGEPRASPTSS
jgi:hypothetical protein